MRRVGLAYRELIGSLYESWTIGIGRVCKKLINSIIQQCQKCQKRGFETKEKGIGTRPQALGGSVTENQRKPPPSPLNEGECGDGKEKR